MSDFFEGEIFLQLQNNTKFSQVCRVALHYQAVASPCRRHCCVRPACETESNTTPASLSHVFHVVYSFLCICALVFRALAIYVSPAQGQTDVTGLTSGHHFFFFFFWPKRFSAFVIKALFFFAISYFSWLIVEEFISGVLFVRAAG